MKLFGRSGGYYLFWSGFIYVMIAIICLVWFREVQPHYLTMTWITMLAIPLVVPPVGRYFNMSPLFGEDMWRKREIGEKVSKDIEDTNNVLKFPELPKLRAVEPSLDETVSPYTIGVNDSGNVQIVIKNDYGSTVLTMNDEGVITLIEDLAHSIRKRYKVDITHKV